MEGRRIRETKAMVAVHIATRKAVTFREDVGVAAVDGEETRIEVTGRDSDQSRMTEVDAIRGVIWDGESTSMLPSSHLNLPN